MSYFEKKNLKIKQHVIFNSCATKGTLSGLRQFLTTESLLKMMKKNFYFTVKAPFILKVFKFLS